MVSYRACKAEPDVGLMEDYAEVEEVMTLRGRPCRWLNLTDADWESIDEAVHEDMDKSFEDY